MGLRINQNISTLTAAKTLQARQKALSKSLDRLSTGQRINSGADDPTGLIVSEIYVIIATALRKIFKAIREK